MLAILFERLLVLCYLELLKKGLKASHVSTNVPSFSSLLFREVEKICEICGELFETPFSSLLFRGGDTEDGK